MLVRYLSAAVLMPAMLLSVMSCTAGRTPAASDPKLDPVKLDDLLVVGETTKAEVLKTLGTPSMTTKTGAGEEVWTYSEMRTVRKREGHWWMLPAVYGGSKKQSSSSMETNDLILEWDKDGILEDFTLLSSRS